MNNFTPTFLAAYLNRSMEENWPFLKEHISLLMSIYIPCETTSKRQNLPWMTAEQRRKSGRKHRLYSKAKSSNDPGSWSTFEQFKRSTAKEQKRARWQNLNTVIQKGFEDNNTRPFWKFAKAQRQDNFGIPPLKHFHS